MEQIAEELVMDVFMKIWTGKEMLLNPDEINRANGAYKQTPGW